MVAAAGAKTDNPGTPTTAAARLKILTKAMSDLSGSDCFTILLFDEESGTAYRIYSSCPQMFAPSGTKPLADAVWAEHLIGRREILVSEGAAAIAAVFDDSEHILAVGIHTIVNVPVILDTRCRGSVNCLYMHNPLQELPTVPMLTTAASLFEAVLDTAKRT